MFNILFNILKHVPHGVCWLSAYIRLKRSFFTSLVQNPCAAPVPAPGIAWLASTGTWLPLKIGQSSLSNCKRTSSRIISITGQPSNNDQQCWMIIYCRLMSMMFPKHKGSFWNERHVQKIRIATSHKTGWVGLFVPSSEWMSWAPRLPPIGTPLWLLEGASTRNITRNRIQNDCALCLHTRSPCWKKTKPPAITQ